MEHKPIRGIDGPRNLRNMKSRNMVTTGPVKPRHETERNITLSLPRTNSNAAGIRMSLSRDDLENMTRGHVVSSVEGVVEQKYILILSLSEVYSASSNSVFVEVTSNSFGREESESRAFRDGLSGRRVRMRADR